MSKEADMFESAELIVVLSRSNKLHAGWNDRPTLIVNAVSLLQTSE